MTDPLPPEECREILAEKLREAGLDPTRFVHVRDGEKGSRDHTELPADSPALSGNYGVYAGAGVGDEGERELVDVDIDDYDSAADDDEALAAIRDLPETLTVISPHTDGETGGHKYYSVPSGTAERLNDEFGSENPDVSWGDLQAYHQYVVGPGSQLDGCGKEWCDDCKEPDKGYYRFANAADIAEVGLEEFVAAVTPGVDAATRGRTKRLDEFEGVSEGEEGEEADLAVSGTADDDDRGHDGLTFEPDTDLDTAADALGAIDPDVGRDAWIRLGYAVHDVDPGPGGRKLFWEWSKRGTKYDDDAQRSIDWIWRNATAGSKITAGTLFEYAQRAGWEPPEDFGGDPVAPLALGALDVLTGGDRERFMRKRGLEIPATDEVRADLRDTLFREVLHGRTTTIDAPTAAGKTDAVATELWGDHPEVTGESPVIHLHPTTDARDQAAARTREAGGEGAVLRGRKEASPLARGDHDPPDDPVAEDAPDMVVTIDGQPASMWFDAMCDRKGLPFSTAYALAGERNDQGLDDLPPQGQEDPAIAQWNGLPRDDDGVPAVDVVHATHQFAYVPSLRTGTNVILDEQPDFSADLGQDRVRRAITAYLQEIDAPVTTFEAFVSLARATLAGASDAVRERDALEEMLGTEPDLEWYVEHADAHALAPALTTAVYRALRWEDADANCRRHARTLHEPPRFDADGGGYGGAWVSVVIDETNTVQTVRETPDFGQARAVVGLDAHPCMDGWRLNTTPKMTREAILDPTERRLWRRYERGLTTVQVGDATRPRSGDDAREWLNDERVRAILERLRDHYGEEFDTAITTAQCEGGLRDLLGDVTGDAVADEQTMHYGEEKSRNPDRFADADAGYVYGCMDPGDDYILDRLAELGVDAEPVRLTEDDVDSEGGHLCETCDGDGCPKCNGTGRKREKGRTFEGPDADVAQAVLASVRENHVAQAAGRYARDPDDPESGGVVFVHTDATPPGFADYHVPGVEWLASDLQREILAALDERPSATVRELADAVDCSKDHVRDTLARLEEEGLAARQRGAGDHGADVYRADDVEGALVDLGVGGVVGETTDDRLCGASRWSSAIWTRHAADPTLATPAEAEAAEPTPVDAADRPPDPGD